MRYFITLEGPDGSGKSSQADMLVEHLRASGGLVLQTREPGGTPIGDQIRKVLMSLDNTQMSPEAEFLLFTASRSQHVRQIIRPHLEQGGIVVCDRFFDSSIAYQGYGHRLNLETLWTITHFATGGLMPDLTFLLDLPVEEGLGRRQAGGHWNRLDAYDLAFHRRVRNGYLHMAEADPERWAVIDARQPPNRVQQEIRRVVNARLEDRK